MILIVKGSMHTWLNLNVNAFDKRKKVFIKKFLFVML